MSEPPADERLVEYLVALTRLENPGAPSLRESVAGALGVDYETMLNAPGEYDEALGMTYAEAADEVYETSVDLIETLAEHDFDIPVSEREAGPDDEVNMNLLVVDLETIGDGRAKSGAHNDLREALAYICEEAQPRVQGAEDEIPRTADALSGEYVPPGGSGARPAAASTCYRPRGTSTRSTRARYRPRPPGRLAARSPRASSSATTTRTTSTPRRSASSPGGRRPSAPAARRSHRCSR